MTGTLLLLTAACWAGPPASFSADRAQRKLLDRLAAPLMKQTPPDADLRPVQELSDRELLDLLAESTWARLPPVVDSPLDVTPVWYHPAVTELTRRCHAEGPEGENLRRLLHERFATVRGTTRTHWALILAQIGDPRGLEDLSRVLTDSQQPIEVRSAAALAMARHPRRIAPNSLAAMLAPWLGQAEDRSGITSGDEPLVLALAWCLIEAQRAQPSYDPARDSVVLRLASLPNPSLRRVAAIAFRARSWDPLPQSLVQLLNDSEPTVRRSALAAATALSSPGARDAVLRMTADANLDVATLAIRQLALYPDVETTSRLSDLWSNSSAAIRQAVLEAAGRLKHEAIAIKGVGDPQASVRIAAARALASIPSEQATRALAKLIRDDRSSVVQAAAIDSLGHHPPSQAGPVLLDALDSAVVRTRAEAALRLAHFLPDAKDFPVADSPEVRAPRLLALRDAWAHHRHLPPNPDSPVASANVAETWKMLVEQWEAGSEEVRTATTRQLTALAASDPAGIESYFLTNDVAPSADFMEQVLAKIDPAYRTLAQMVTSSDEPLDPLCATLAGEWEHRRISPLQGVIVAVEAARRNDRALWTRCVPIVQRDFTPQPGPANAGIYEGLTARALVSLASRGLTHPDEIVREETCRWLADHPMPQLSNQVAELMNDPTERVRRAAIRAAGATATEDVAPSLHAALRSPSVAIQLEAAAQLYARGDAMGIEQLRRLYASADHEVRARVVDELAENHQINREESLRLLTQALSDDKLEVRQRAVDGLEKAVGQLSTQKPGRTIPLDQRVAQWKRTMDQYFAAPKAEDPLRQIDRLRDTQEKMSLLPIAN